MGIFAARTAGLTSLLFVAPSVVLAVVLAACGAEPAKPVTPVATAEAPAASASAVAEAPAPTPSASASAEAAAPPVKKSSGRPAVLKSDPEQIVDTFGSSPSAKLELGDKEVATLKIPEFALKQTINLMFQLAKNGKTGGPQVGKIYQIIPTIPPHPTPATIASDGPPFEVIMPAGRGKDANLAVGTIEVDDKGRERITWEILAPKRIDDATNTAHFELTRLTDSYLHITTKKPTEAKK